MAIKIELKTKFTHAVDICVAGRYSIGLSKAPHFFDQLLYVLNAVLSCIRAESKAYTKYLLSQSNNWSDCVCQPLLSALKQPPIVLSSALIGATVKTK